MMVENKTLATKRKVKWCRREIGLDQFIYHDSLQFVYLSEQAGRGKYCLHLNCSAFLHNISLLQINRECLLRLNRNTRTRQRWINSSLSVWIGGGWQLPCCSMYTRADNINLQQGLQAGFLLPQISTIINSNICNMKLNVKLPVSLVWR